MSYAPSNLDGMTNPALLLADVLQRWAVPSPKSPEKVRANGNPASEEFWKEHAVVLSLLSDIERSLTAMEASGDDVAHYRATLPAWYQAVFTYTLPWKSQAQVTLAPILADHDFRLLRALAGQISSVGWVPKILPEDIESARAAFTAAEELIQSDETLPASLKRYLVGLASEAKTALDEYTVTGTVYLRRITMELGGAMVTVSEMKEEPNVRKRWSARAKAVLFSVAVIAGTKALEAGVDKGMDALPG
jgi:hypothetical protein